MAYLGRRRHGMVISPGRSAGSDGCSGATGGSLGLRRLDRNLNLNPLLRSCQVVTSVPLVLASGIGSVVTNVGIGDRGLRRALGRMAIRQDGQSSVGARVDLGQASIGDGGISLDSIDRLDRGGLSLCRYLVQRSRVCGSRGFDSCNYEVSVHG